MDGGVCSRRTTMKSITKNAQSRGNGRIDTSIPRKAALKVKLPGSVCVPAPLYDEIKESIQHNRSEFGNFNLLVMEDLIGIDRWPGYSDTEKQAASACVAYLYQTDQLPLELLEFELKTTGGCVLSLTR
jgi:hypothetical protein